MDQLREAMLEIQRLVTDQSLDSKKRFDSIEAKVSAVFDAENPEWNERLLYFAENTSRGLAEIVADEYEKRITQSRANADGVFIELNALPVLFLTKNRDVERAEWTALLPPSSSGEPIPFVSDILLSWSDLTRNQQAIWGLLRSLNCDGPHSDEQFIAMKANRKAFDTYDPIMLDDETQSTLRFLLCYRRSDDKEFHKSPAEKLEWAEKARKAIGEGIDVRAPRKMSEALYTADGMAKYFIASNLVNNAIRQGCDPRNVFLLAEDFGFAQRGLSGYVRLSVCNSTPQNWIWRNLIFRALPSDRARWRHGNDQFGISCNSAGIKTLIVDHIQSAKLVEEPIDCLRLHLIFGPSVAFNETPPDGYPADVFSQPSIDATTKKWMDYDFESLPSTYNLVQAVLESLLETLQVSDAETGFVLREGKWRPSLIMDLRPKSPETLECFRGRLDKVFDYILSYLQLNAAVAWIIHDLRPSLET